MPEPRPPAAALALLLSAAVLLPTDAPAQEGGGEAEPGAPYVPTPMNVVVEMLRMAGVSARDTVYDLGSGDGRLPVTAARLYGARGVGVELDSGLVNRSRRHARGAGVDSLVRFIRGDLFETDLRPATVVTLYLFPGMNERLRPRILREMEPGDRVVAHDFSMGDWKADSVARVPEENPELDLFDEVSPLGGWDGFGGPEAGVDSLVRELNQVGGRATVYRWVIPADAGGTWRVSLPSGGSARLRIDQRFQELRAHAAGETLDGVASARVRADTVELRLRTADGRLLRLTGTVDGGRMGGEDADGRPWSARRVADSDASLLEWEAAAGG